MPNDSNQFPQDNIFASLQAAIDALVPDAERELLQWDFDLVVAVIAALPRRIEAAAMREAAVTEGHEKALRKLQELCARLGSRHRRNCNGER
jgi:hypothetical protein